MRIISVVVAVTLSAVAVSTAAPRIVGGPFRNPANNHLYYLLESATWTDSEARAVELGGHLVAIGDAAENDWVVETFGNFAGESRHLWIGLTDQLDEDSFRWTSGERFTFSNWNVGEPNNSGGTPGEGGYEEDFVYIIAGSEGGVWNDVPNDGYGVLSPLYGVVEIQPARQPSSSLFRFNHPSNVRPGGWRPRKLGQARD